MLTLDTSAVKWLKNNLFSDNQRTDNLFIEMENTIILNYHIIFQCMSSQSRQKNL